MLLHADCARLARCRAHAPAPRRPGAGTVPSRATSGARRARERIFRKKKQKDVTVASTRRVQLCVHVCVVCESRTVRTSSASGRTYTSRPHHTAYWLLHTQSHTGCTQPDAVPHSMATNRQDATRTRDTDMWIVVVHIPVLALQCADPHPHSLRLRRVHSLDVLDARAAQGARTTVAQDSRCARVAHANVLARSKHAALLLAQADHAQLCIFVHDLLSCRKLTKSLDLLLLRRRMRRRLLAHPLHLSLDLIHNIHLASGSLRNLRGARSAQASSLLHVLFYLPVLRRGVIGRRQRLWHRRFLRH